MFFPFFFLGAGVFVSIVLWEPILFSFFFGGEWMSEVRAMASISSDGCSSGDKERLASG